MTENGLNFLTYPRWYALNGAVGDIIYGCAAIKAAGGGHLFIFDWPHRTGAWPMTLERFEQFRRLLEFQPYIESLRYITYRREHNLCGFRDWRGNGWKTIADQHLDTLGLSWQHRSTPWLRVDESRSLKPVIFHRSLHFNNPDFPWQRVYDKYSKDAVFVGWDNEHEVFSRDFGPIEHVKTADLLEVARLIAGSRLFIGNQSACFAVAEGLKANAILEVDPKYPDCLYSRINVLHGWNDHIELPEIP